MSVTRSRDMGYAATRSVVPPRINEASSTNVTFSSLTNPDGDGKNYRLAVWNATGTLVVLSAGSVQALIVNGGYSGAGVSNNSSGGGQGGDTRLLPALVLSAGTITVTVGAGGSGIVGAPVAGGASSIGSVATSGGGGSLLPGGAAGTTSTPGTGGRGISCGITGSVVVYSGGGGGGNGVASNGGASGGGQGEYTVGGGQQTAGTANTGGGGGGRWNSGSVAGANGGSGKVCIRWEV